MAPVILQRLLLASLNSCEFPEAEYGSALLEALNNECASSLKPVAKKVAFSKGCYNVEILEVPEQEVAAVCESGAIGRKHTEVPLLHGFLHGHVVTLPYDFFSVPLKQYNSTFFRAWGPKSIAVK